MDYGQAISMNLKKYFNFGGNDIIEFYCHPDFVGVIPEPIPAVKNLPEWFKRLDPYTESKKENLQFEDKVEKVDRDDWGNPAFTAKKCLPMLDAMSLGYTIPLAGDVHIMSNRDNTKLHVVNPKNLEVCSHHKSWQVGGDHKLGIKHGDALKFINFWIIKTAPGWSSLFISPLNHFDKKFVCLSGLVDTDTYPVPVNFPAVLTAYDVDLHIPMGTPLVTVIPIKRDTFPKKPQIKEMTEKDMNATARIQRKQQMASQIYTKHLRKRD